MEKKSFFGWPLAIVLGLMYFMSSGFVLATAQIVNPMMLQDPSMGLTGTVLGAGFSLFVLMQDCRRPSSVSSLPRRALSSPWRSAASSCSWPPWP